MKSLLYTFVIFSLVSIIGCQEDISTDPYSIPTNKASQLTYETIEICCQVYDPLTGACSVTGYVYYQHQIINNPADEMGVYTIQLSLDMNLELCSLCMMVHPEWKIKEVSEETVTVSEEGIALVEKYYPISNREDIILCIQYLVTTEGVGVPAVWIQEVDVLQ